ncbi:MAG: methyltransferase domain-containing protein [Caldilineaceae bacterium]|nr:methyltransferase domain-containing protein [Caldilineaceae bacterium]
MLTGLFAVGTVILWLLFVLTEAGIFKRHQRARISPSAAGTAIAADDLAADEVIGQCWGQAAAHRERMSQMGWLDSPLVRNAYVLPTIAQGFSSGDAWVDLVQEFQIDRQGRWLSLGCGSAGPEIFFAQAGLFASMDAYDISAGAIAIARENALARGVKNIDFRVGEFDALELPPEHYDVVSMIMSLHHARHLDALLTKIQATLRPTGWFLVNEYIGPSQLQYTDKQLQFVAELLSILPPRLAYDFTEGAVRRQYVRKPREFWNRVDPSEAICSDHIEAALHEHFDVVAQRNFGGSLLNPLLENLVANFSPDAEEDVAILRLLMYVEEVLIREGILTSDFAVFVMRKKTTNPGPAETKEASMG